MTISEKTVSEELFARAQKVMPGGVNSPVRAFRAVGGRPVFIDRGEGAYLFDVDGRRYLDFVGSWGPLLLGHAHPEVVRNIQEAAAKGTSFGAPTRLETEMAELILEAFPGMDMVRMVNSGTEATMSALRLARGFTGRSKIVKFIGNYHGHADSFLIRAGSGAVTLGVPDSPGVPPTVAGDTLTVPYNDLQAVEEVFARFGRDIAAVIVEPVAANMGVVPPTPGFLEGLRDVTRRNGALLIFDEVITGFRLAWGGAQTVYGIEPDLTCLGKIVGGGLPVGAYGGRREVMEKVAPSGPVYQAGTLAGNPLAMTAGLTMLRLLRDDKDEIYPYVDSLAARLADGIERAAAKTGIPHQVNRVGSLVCLFFTGQPVRDYDSALTADLGLFARWFQAMLRRGMYLAPSQFEALFVSAAHAEDDIARATAAAEEALAEAARPGTHS